MLYVMVSGSLLASLPPAQQTAVIVWSALYSWDCMYCIQRLRFAACVPGKGKNDYGLNKKKRKEDQEAIMIQDGQQPAPASGEATQSQVVFVTEKESAST